MTNNSAAVDDGIQFLLLNRVGVVRREGGIFPALRPRSNYGSVGVDQNCGVARLVQSTHERLEDRFGREWRNHLH